MTAIPGYTILRTLGQGGMATVYLAVQESLGREVALKVLSPALASDPVATERFLREAHVAARLHHPNIIPVHDVGVADQQPYMAMAFEPGGTLAVAARTGGDAGLAVRAVRDIAAALDHAHQMGVVHRDIKPENMLCRADGAAVLTDFGIARTVALQPGLTAEGCSVGTPHYMSPEQWRGEAVDGRSDLYSLGIVFYQLLTGQLPFQGADGWAVGMQHMNATVPRLPEAHARWQPLLDGLLAKQASQRPQTGAEVVQRIDAVLKAPTLALAAPMATTVNNSLPPAARRARWSVALALTTVVALTLGALWSASWTRTPETVTTAARETPSIAVLPFVDMSENKDQDYFSDGLSEELLDRLAKLPKLKVAGRTSSFAFKGKTDDLRSIGQRLGVSTVLEGSVRKSGSRLRITAQLINVGDGFHLWSQSYDRELTDVFAVQDEIAAAVVSALRVELLPTSADPPHHHVPGPQAYELYLRGRHELVDNATGHAARALAAFEQAVALEPEYALAHSDLAMAASFVANELETSDPAASARMEERAHTAADRAVALDPKLPEAFAARGFIRFRIERDWTGARADLDTALALDPNNARTLLRHGAMSAKLGELRQAIKDLRRASEIDPAFPPTNWELVVCYKATGDYANARATLRHIAALQPDNPWLARQETLILLLEGRDAEARSRFEADAMPMFRLFGLAIVLHRLGDAPAAAAALKALVAEHHQSAAFQIAEVYAAMGDVDLAFEWLERAHVQKDRGLDDIQRSPLLQPLHADPRYAAFLNKLGFPS